MSVSSSDSGRGRVPRPVIVLAVIAAAVGGIIVAGAAHALTDARTVQFVVTSDAHYGITRQKFRGVEGADAQMVNRALVSALNRLPDERYPADRGLGAGQRVGAIDFVVETGDITNREEHHDETLVQPAAASWAQFVADYIDGLRLTTADNAPTPLYLVPGNHEASNALGFYKAMIPPADAGPLVEIYNRMLMPSLPKTVSTFDYQSDRLFYTRDVGGVHLVFLQIWPDSAMRARMDADLATVSATTPVFVFAHDQPEVEAKHFVNPNGVHDINAVDQFENLLSDRFSDGDSSEAPAVLEQGEFERFLARHPNVTAYFHGNSNWHQAYEWNGPRRSARLHVFRVDSPMKGAVSSLDETRLSFAVATLDAESRALTVRECLWNIDPARPSTLGWGDAVSVTLDPRPTASRQSR